jgi:hypothetical protein
MSDFAAFTLLAAYLAHIALLSQRLDALATLARYVRRRLLDNGEPE